MELQTKITNDENDSLCAGKTHLEPCVSSSAVVLLALVKVRSKKRCDKLSLVCNK